MNPIFATDSWQSFMEAIRANPLDDLPRLVSADWLDETGEKEVADFAMFIRLQCEIAAMEAGGSLRCERSGVNISKVGDWKERCRCRPCSLRRKEWSVWSKRSCEWTTFCGPSIGKYESDIREWAANGGLRPSSQTDQILFPHFFGDPSRGFYSTIRTTMPAWMRYGPLAVRGPFAALERVEFRDKQPFEYYSEYFKRNTYSWHRVDLEAGLTDADRQSLSTPIYNRLRHGPKSLDGDRWSRGYRSASDAISALSAAALKFAWSQTPPE